MSGTLYLVATPIGNLGDFSPRAVETLAQVDFIAAEDTRVSLKLLNHFGVKKPLISYHQHNQAAAGPAILDRLLAGETCALVTDAGTPAVSDPGEALVRLCAQHDVPVLSIPGCCALVSALAVSGLATGRFTFEGFLSVNKKSRREHLQSLAAERRTMVFYEAPHKLRFTLADLARAAMFSPWYAHRIFREQTGCSPADYIRRLRLSRSALRLRDASIRVIDAAVECGFESVDGYQRAFLRVFGCNPKEYAVRPVPLPLFTAYGAKFQECLRKERCKISDIKNVFIQVVEKPSRRVIIKRGVAAKEYMGYCEEVGCDVWGVLTS